MPNLFAIFLTSLLALSLSACKAEQIQEQLEQRLKAEGHIAPTVAELGLNLSAPPVELVGQTATTYVSPIQYTAKAGKTYHYDKDGKLTDKPTSDGYYRNILGVTADGRTVAQDFYTSHAPQTAPFILKQGADESNFENHVIEGDIIWFDELGNIEQTFSHDSEWISFFKEGQIIGRTLETKPDTIVVVNYPNSQKIMAYFKYVNTVPKEITHMYFYENGNAMLKVIKDDKDNVSEVLTWDEAGKSVKPKKFAKDHQETLANMDKIINEVLGVSQNP